jgi:hypothetical protein
MFVRKKDLIITGGISSQMVQFQMENYWDGKSIIVKQELQQKPKEQ